MAARKPSVSFAGCAYTTRACERQVTMPKLPSFETVKDAQQGFSIELSVAWHAAAQAGDILLDARKPTGAGAGAGQGPGVAVVVPEDGGLALILAGPTPNTTFSHPVPLSQQTIKLDPGCAALLADEFPHHVHIIADAGPLIAMFLVDGQFCDGGGVVSAGWSWLQPFKHVNGAAHLSVAPSYGGELQHGALFTRSLRVSEAVASYRALRGRNRTLAKVVDGEEAGQERGQQALKSDDDLSARVCDIRKHGAVGDGKHLDTHAIEAALSSCSGGGTILVPALLDNPCALGNLSSCYLTTPINLTSHQTLHVEHGAGLIGSVALDKTGSCSRQDGQEHCSWPLVGYPVQPSLRSYDDDRYCAVVSSCKCSHTPCASKPQRIVCTDNQTDVHISGEGVIDGQGWALWPDHVQSNMTAQRPHLVELYACSGCSVQDVALRNSAFWTLHLIYSDQITVRG